MGFFAGSRSLHHSQSFPLAVLQYQTSDNMKSGKNKQNPTSYAVSIRRKRRQDEMQQFKNTVRFNTELHTLLDEIEDECPVYQLSQDQLDDYIENQEYEPIFNAIINGSQQVQEVIEYKRNIVRIIECLFERLSMPNTAVALYRLCKWSYQSIPIIIQTGKLKLITSQLKRLSAGTNEQNIYIGCIREILNRKELYELSQIATFFPIIEQLFYKYKQEHIENNIIIATIQSLIYLSDSKYNFSIEFVLEFLEQFWSSSNGTNLINIYHVAEVIAKFPPYNRSINVLISAIRIVLRGRGRLPSDSKYVKKSKVDVLTYIMKQYNLRQENKENFGVIKVDEKNIQVTLHTFLLYYEFTIFQSEIDEKLMNFLWEFCLYGPVNLIGQVWNRMGIIQKMIKIMPKTTAEFCFFSLRICQKLLSQLRGNYREYAGQYLKYYLIEQTMEEVLEIFYNAKIRSLCDSVTALLHTK